MVIHIEKKRLTAIKTRIESIAKGRYVPAEGFNPSYVLTNTGLQISRARLLSTVVDKFNAESGKFASITLDDGTDTIRAKAFNAVSIFESIDIGSFVELIGRIKEFQGEIYLQPEIIRKLDDPNLELLRELELKEQEKNWKKKIEIVLEYQKQVSDMNELKNLMKERFGIQPHEVESVLASGDEVSEEPKKDKDRVLSLITELDKGTGCDYSDLIQASGLSEDVLDLIINSLLNDGICFEPRPGKIKKL